jgi:hypothetical protein
MRRPAPRGRGSDTAKVRLIRRPTSRVRLPVPRFYYDCQNFGVPNSSDRVFQPGELVLLRETAGGQGPAGLSADYYQRQTRVKRSGLLLPQELGPVSVVGLRYGDVQELLRRRGFAGGLFPQKWRAFSGNLIPNEGLQEIVQATFKDQALYVVLTTTATPLATWTMANGETSAWTQFVSYSGGVRIEWTDGSITGTTTKSVDNVGSEASHSITGGGTIQAAGLTDSSTLNGTAGNLLSMAALSGGARVVASSDILLVTVTITMTDDGV